MKKLSVVLADDEVLALEGLLRLVQSQGEEFRVAGTAANGLEALSLIQSTRPDMVFTDIRMPKMDGIQLLHRLEVMDDPPLVIIVSAYDDREYLRHAIHSPIVYDYINKPFLKEEFSELLHAAADYCRRKHSNADPRTTAQSLVAEMIQSIQWGDRAAVLAAFQRWWELRRSGDLNEDILRAREMVTQISWSLYAGSSSQAAVYQLWSNIQGVEECTREEDVEQYLKAYVSRCCEGRAEQERKITALVASCLDIINRRLGDKDLSIPTVAAELKVTPNYLSGRFSRDMDMSFTKYVTTLRVERAKELLADVGLKVYEISSMVGFDDVRYFDKVFKDREGASPSEYRNHLLGG